MVYVVEEKGLSTFHTSPNRKIPGGLTLAEYYKDHHAELTRAEKEYVSMADGVASEGGGVYEFEPVGAYAELYSGASLVTVKLENPSPGGGSQVQPALRGAVVGFSSASRRRLMRTIARVNRNERPVFVTLTYPDEFPKEKKKWKRDMDVFGKRVRRAFPDAAFVWRIEFKERKTGKRAGDVAPHFHLLVYRASFRQLRKWVSRAWYSTVGSGDTNHLLVGTRVEIIHSYGGIMRYVGKYIAKVDAYPEEWVGRTWGIVGRERLPWGVRVVIPLLNEDAIRAVRLGRKMIRLTGRTLVYGLTWLMNAERALAYLEYLWDSNEREIAIET